MAEFKPSAVIKSPPDSNISPVGADVKVSITPRPKNHPRDLKENTEGQKRGRPRIESNRGTAADIRRAQIRNAQHKFQHKKELEVNTLRQRLENANGHVNNISSKLEYIHEFLLQHGVPEKAPELSRCISETFAELRSVSETVGKGDLSSSGTHKSYYTPSRSRPSSNETSYSVQVSRPSLPEVPATNNGLSPLIDSGPEDGRIKATEINAQGMRRLSVRFSDPIEISPVSIFGAGRIDPFNTFSVGQTTEQVNEFIDYVVSVHFPGLCPASKTLQTSPLTASVMPRAVNSPLIFHALIYAASTILNIRHGRPPEYNSAFRLFHKGETIKYIIQALDSSNQKWTDETIMGILTLMTTSDTYTSANTEFQTFYPPLTSLGWLDVYGKMKAEQTHTEALTSILNSIGGLEGIQMPSLARLISSAYIRTGSMGLHCSPFPDIKERNYSWRAFTGSRLYSKGQLGTTLGHAFEQLELYGLTHQMMTILRDMSDMTIVVDKYCRGELGNVDLSDISDWRTTIQHSLMSLPERSSDSSMIPIVDLYESCRLSMLIYAFAATFPTPFHREIREKLTMRLRASIQSIPIEECVDSVAHFVMWCLFLGGISAHGLPDQEWYVQMAARIAFRLGIISWSEARGNFLYFLWLESSINPGAEKMWAEVEMQLINKAAYVL